MHFISVYFHLENGVVHMWKVFLESIKYIFILKIHFYIFMWYLLIKTFSVRRESQLAVQVRSGTKTSRNVKVNIHSLQICGFLFFVKLRRINIVFFTECPLGFHSFNCSVACKFPSFGDDCQYLCNCSESSCDHRFGCNKFSGKLIKIVKKSLH